MSLKLDEVLSKLDLCHERIDELQTENERLQRRVSSLESRLDDEVNDRERDDDRITSRIDDLANELRYK